MTIQCVICGQPLGGDPDDGTTGEGEVRPMCGECTRARNFDDLLWQMDASDGDLDGRIDEDDH